MEKRYQALTSRLSIYGEKEPLAQCVFSVRRKVCASVAQLDRAEDS